MTISLSIIFGFFSLFGLIQRIKNGLQRDNVNIKSDNEFCEFQF